jgi:hypothetical protein
MQSSFKDVRCVNGGSVLIPPHGRQLESEMDDGSQLVEKEEVGLSKAPRLYPIAPGPFTSLSIVNSPQALLAPTFLIGFKGLALLSNAGPTFWVSTQNVKMGSMGEINELLLMPCLRIIKECVNMKTAVTSSNTRVSCLPHAGQAGQGDRQGDA